MGREKKKKLIRKKENGMYMARGEGGGAPEGNENAKKLTTSELKHEAYKAFCEHIAQGYTTASFWFVKDDLKITGETIETYIKNDVEFDPQNYQMAKCQGLKRWTKICMDSATGKDKRKSNTASLQMFMRNTYGWDKQEKEKPTQLIEDAALIIKKLLNNISPPLPPSNHERQETIDIPVRTPQSESQE